MMEIILTWRKVDGAQPQNVPLAVRGEPPDWTDGVLQWAVWDGEDWSVWDEKRHVKSRGVILLPPPTEYAVPPHADRP